MHSLVLIGFVGGLITGVSPYILPVLAGQRVGERVAVFRRHQRTIRIARGVVTIALAVALVFNLPAALQRAIPDYTSGLQDKVAAPGDMQQKPNLGGIVNGQNRQLSNCSGGVSQLQNYCPATDLTGINGQLNTPGGAPVDLTSLRGEVVPTDFGAYSCINCQRAIPRVVGWDHANKNAGLEVIGVHTPEYAVERVPANVAGGAAVLNISP